MRAPPVERRSIEEFAQEIREELGPVRDVGGTGEALVQIMARYAELIADRLNQAPDNLFLAYLEMLGAALQPPQAARVPLTFYLAEGATTAYVKRGTKVEAVRGPGDKEPVTFETEADLRMTSARLDMVMWKDPGKDEYADLSAVLARPCSLEVPVFRTNSEYPGRRTPHELWIGIRVPKRLKHLDAVRFQFRLATDSGISKALRWECYAVAGWSALEPAFDTTSGFAKTGDVLFTDWTPVAPLHVLGLTAHWFRCICTDAIAVRTPAATLPVITGLECSMEVRRSGLPPERVYAAEALDPANEMWVFGARPTYGSTLYLRHDEAFGVARAQVTLTVDLVNPRGAKESPVPLVNAVATRLNWEAWDGKQWTVIGVSEAGAAASDPVRGFEETTKAFTKSGEVRLRIPETTGPVAVAGESGYWVRVRIAFGDYGREAAYEQNAAGTFVYTPSTLAPPLVRSLQLSFQTQVDAQIPYLVRNHDFHLELLATVQPAVENNRKTQNSSSREPAASATVESVTPVFPIRPFLPIAENESDAAMYFGFSPPVTATEKAAPPGSREFADGDPSVELSLYVQIRGRGAISAGLGTEASWERRGPASDRWISLPVHDQTLGLAKSGMVRSVAAFKPTAENLFGQHRIWIRVRPLLGVTQVAMLEAALLNTIPALHVQTTEREILGSGVGKPVQTFDAARKPVLEGQQLQVLETSVPSAPERAKIRLDEGADAIQPAEPGQGPGQWIRWHEVPDFQNSGPRDRHYVLDRLAGRFTFGDGANGLAPPAGTANVRLRIYRTGGGSGGNKAAHEVVDLKSSVPRVNKVVNHIAASGGSDEETLAHLRERFPRELRHRDRAVTPEDYEDLAGEASRQVQRAKCVPLHDLGSDPAARRRVPGTVSLIVLLRSSQQRPVADTEVLARVQEYIGKRQPSSARLVVVPAEFIRIDIEAEVVVSDAADRSRVEAQAAEALRMFLHPCTGQKGAGWDFGTMPKHSDINALLQAIPGLEYVAMLRISQTPEREGAEQQNRFAIYCGEPRITARGRD